MQVVERRQTVNNVTKVASKEVTRSKSERSQKVKKIRKANVTKMAIRIHRV
jgi:hypothetical protein